MDCDEYVVLNKGSTVRFVGPLVYVSPCVLMEVQTYHKEMDCDEYVVLNKGYTVRLSMCHPVYQWRCKHTISENYFSQTPTLTFPPSHFSAPHPPPTHSFNIPPPQYGTEHATG
jgi:hypothetical protein